MAKPETGSHLMQVASATITYEGWAIRKGALTSTSVWKIRRITFDAAGEFTKEEYAHGNELYDQKWDDRAVAGYWP